MMMSASTCNQSTMHNWWELSCILLWPLVQTLHMQWECLRDSVQTLALCIRRLSSTCVVMCRASKLQPVVMLSTTEAEHCAAVEAGKEAIWMRQLLRELGFDNAPSSSCWNNSQSRLPHRQTRGLGLGASTNSAKRVVHPGPRDKCRRAQTGEHTGDAANSKHATGGATVATWSARAGGAL